MTKIGKFAVVALVLSLFASLNAFGAIKVVATVDSNNVVEGDGLIYSVSVSSEGTVQFDSEPKLPSLVGLELVNASSSTESRSTFINGKFTVEQTRSFNYQMATPRKGTFTIGPTSVIIAGKEYKTEPITIHVAGEGRGAGNQAQQRRRNRQNDPMADQMEDMEDMFNQLLQRRMGGGAGGFGGQGQQQINPNDAFFIQVDVDKTKVYAGEQITASWYLYTRGQIADIDTLKYPDLKGFWKEEIEMATRLNFQQAVVNGVVYQKALLVSYALFPIKAGRITIDPYKAKCTVVIGGPFGFGRPYPFTKASRAVSVDVMEVPKEGRPPEFSGAVGRFQISATLDQTSVPENQPVTLKVRFAGRGNAKLIDLPPLALPPSVEVYSQKSDAKYSKDGTSSKEFEVLLIPRQEGKIEIPSIRAAYFDPELAKFQTISSPKLNLEVTPGKPGDHPVIPQAANGPTTPQTASGPLLPPPMMLGGAQGFQSLAGLRFAWYGIFALIFMGLGGKSYTVFFRRPKVESLQIALKKRIRKVQGAIDAGDWRKAGVELTNSIYLILGKITDQGGANLEFQKLMEDAPPSIRRELSGPLRAILDRSEQLGFAPEATVGALKQKAELNKLRKEVEQVLSKAISLSQRDA